MYVSSSSTLTHDRHSGSEGKDETLLQYSSEGKNETVSQGIEGRGGGVGEGEGGWGGDMFGDLYARLLLHQDHQQQKSRGGYISTHMYTLEDTCSMTPLQLKRLLSPIYEKYADKF